MRAVVSGAHGFLGSHIVERLLASGWAVRALVSPWGRIDKLLHLLDRPGLEIVRGDITDRDSLEGVCRGSQAVVHSAARVADYGPWELFRSVNVEGTENLLRQAEIDGVERFVFVSSVAVFRYRGFSMAEARNLERDNVDQPYARSKIEAEDLVMAATRCSPTVVRPGLWPFGARDGTFAAIVRALRRGQLPLVGDGTALLNTAYAPNFAEGVVLATMSSRAEGRSYVLADEGQPSWNELFRELAGLLGVPPPRIHLPEVPTRIIAGALEALWRTFHPQGEPPITSYRAGLTLHDVHFDLSAARDELGFVAGVDWREGMRRSVLGLDLGTPR